MLFQYQYVRQAPSSILSSIPRNNQGSSTVLAVLAHLDGNFVAEFAIVPDIIVTTRLAEAVAAAHAAVYLADLDQAAVVLVRHLERAVALWILALEC
jgi:hypothetical protein